MNPRDHKAMNLQIWNYELKAWGNQLLIVLAFTGLTHKSKVGILFSQLTYVQKTTNVIVEQSLVQLKYWTTKVV